MKHTGQVYSFRLLEAEAKAEYWFPSTSRIPPPLSRDIGCKRVGVLQLSVSQYRHVNIGFCRFAFISEEETIIRVKQREKNKQNKTEEKREKSRSVVEGVDPLNSKKNYQQLWAHG